MSHTVYKGLDKTLEFMGIGGQYLMLFLGGIVGIVLVVLILSSTASTLVTIVFAAASLLALWCYVTYMHDKYGRYGVMQGQARKSCPRFLISRKRVKSML
jgi:membrane protein implicated in regulation of membrane protease activity